MCGNAGVLKIAVILRTHQRGERGAKQLMAAACSGRFGSCDRSTETTAPRRRHFASVPRVALGVVPSSRSCPEECSHVRRLRRSKAGFLDLFPPGKSRYFKDSFSEAFAGVVNRRAEHSRGGPTASPSCRGRLGDAPTYEHRLAPPASSHEHALLCVRKYSPQEDGQLLLEAALKAPPLLHHSGPFLV